MDFDPLDPRIRKEYIKKIKRHNAMVDSRNYIQRMKRLNCLIWLLVFTILILLLLYSTHNLGFYNGLNKGIYILNCGFEFVGDFGVFCNG